MLRLELAIFLMLLCDISCEEVSAFRTIKKDFFIDVVANFQPLGTGTKNVGSRFESELAKFYSSSLAVQIQFFYF